MQSVMNVTSKLRQEGPVVNDPICQPYTLLLPGPVSQRSEVRQSLLLQNTHRHLRGFDNGRWRSARQFPSILQRYEAGEDTAGADAEGCEVYVSGIGRFELYQLHGHPTAFQKGI